MAQIEIKSEVTGKVWKIMKKIGNHINSGDTVMIIESMKMEIPVIAEDSGTLSKLRIAEGQSVEDGDVVAFVDTD